MRPVKVYWMKSFFVSHFMINLLVHMTCPFQNVAALTAFLAALRSCVWHMTYSDFPWCPSICGDFVPFLFCRELCLVVSASPNHCATISVKDFCFKIKLYHYLSGKSWDSTQQTRLQEYKPPALSTLSPPSNSRRARFELSNIRSLPHVEESLMHVCPSLIYMS